MEKFSSCLGVLTGIIAIVILNMLLGGWACVVLWGWFITPAFGITPPSIPVAMGIMLLFNLVSHREQRGKDDRSADERIQAVAESLASPIVAIALGWIVKMFV